MEACQRAVSSREFLEWVAFDAHEPIGTRVVPGLLADLLTLLANVHRKPGSRPYLPQDFLPNPLAPARLSTAQETERTAMVALDYRRLRKERLAREAAGGTMPAMERRPN